MMINKRLIGTVKESKKYIAGNVTSQWISLAANISIMGAIAKMLQNLYEGTAGEEKLVLTAVVAAAAIAVRFLCAIVSSRMSYLSSKEVKKTLRQMIYRKLLRLGSSYHEQIKTCYAGGRPVSFTSEFIGDNQKGAKSCTSGNSKYSSC